MPGPVDVMRGLALALTLCGTAVSAAAAADCPVGGGTYKALHPRQWQALMDVSEPSPGASACRSEPCHAAYDIGCTAVAMSGILGPNTMGYLTPEYAMQALRERERYVSTFPYAHPRRIPLYCTYLTRLAALTPDEPKRDGDNSVYFTIELALRIWPLDRSCLPRVRAAFPDTPNIRSILEIKTKCMNSPTWCLPRLQPRVHLAHRRPRQR